MKKLLLILLFLLAPIMLFADEEMENKVREIAHQLRCPTCQALSVKESDAGLASNMKMKIRSMLEEGKSEQEILDFFIQRYGEWILRSPQKTGFNLVLWLGPGFLVLLSGLGVILVVRKKTAHALSGEITPLSAKEKAEIEKDMEGIE